LSFPPICWENRVDEKSKISKRKIVLILKAFIGNIFVYINNFLYICLMKKYLFTILLAVGISPLFSQTEDFITEEIETKLYPIPAQEKFFIQSEKQIKNIIIINQLGIIVEQFNPISNSIDISKFDSGKYVIVLYDGLKEKRFNIIKQ
jgi:hypothetical protein